MGRSMGRMMAVAAAGIVLMAVSARAGEAGKDASMDRLALGNSRYVSGAVAKRGDGDTFRAALAKGQAPYAVIVACSDSRVAPEIIFDEGLGRLFVVRTAGNVVDAVALGSIEYAVEHLGTPLVVVVGHESCGAVKAAVEHEGELHGNIGEVVRHILPAVKAAREKAGRGADIYKEAAIQNIKTVMKNIASNSPVVAEAVEKGEVRIEGVYYSISTGKVSIAE